MGYLVGQRVFVVRTTSYKADYRAGTIVKITPSGFIDVQMEKSIIRFNKYGDQTGVSSFRKEYIDKTPFEERLLVIAKYDRTKTAMDALIDLLNGGEFHVYHSSMYDKDSILNIIATMQEKIDLAKKAAEAI